MSTHVTATVLTRVEVVSVRVDMPAHHAEWLRDLLANKNQDHPLKNFGGMKSLHDALDAVLGNKEPT